MGGSPVCVSVSVSSFCRHKKRNQPKRPIKGSGWGCERKRRRTGVVGGRPPTMRGSSRLSWLIAVLAVRAEALAPEFACPSNCNSQGYCHDGICVCYPGWTGADCSTLTQCPHQCNLQGAVLPPLTSSLRALPAAPSSSSTSPERLRLVVAGYCLNATCVCYPGFSGDDCSLRLCPQDCSGRGQCHQGKCKCHANFTGAACDRSRCPADCTSADRFTSCEEGVCNCKPGYFGLACELKACPNGCTSFENGVCDEVFGKCACHEGWTGDDCSQKSCPLDCSGKGLCVNGSCFCPEGSGGAGCESLFCGTPCVHGKHSNATCACECEPGWRGEACSVAGCPEDCSGHGTCAEGTLVCACDEGWGGPACDTALCPGGCSAAGSCLNGTCLCAKGHFGADCSHKECPCGLSGQECSAHGKCNYKTGECACEHWWEGADCAQRSCLSRCSGNGKCFNGTCLCYTGWMGSECSMRACPGRCSGRGTCLEDGSCACAAGSSGRACPEWRRCRSHSRQSSSARSGPSW